MVKPEFLIVGAPKCGTTSLYDYLNQHTKIFLPRIKEPHYFGQDLSPSEFKGNTELYLELFHNKQGKVTGEASTWYLYSKTAAKEIMEFNPDMKIIIMIRNPVYAAQSLHSQALYLMNEEVENFSDALELEVDRMNGLGIPKNAKRIESLFYADVYKYSEQILRYIEVFGREMVHIILFEDFVKNTEKSVRETLIFLGINDDFVPTLEVKNSSKTVRSNIFHSILQRSDKRFIKKVPLGLRRRVKEFLLRLNTTSKVKEVMSEEQIEKLHKEFENDIDKTSKLIGENLDSWKYK